jgi:26S proteasome regulatory subunit T2
MLKQLRIKDHLLMEEETVALYQARQREKEVKEGNKKDAAGAAGSRDTDDETLLASLKGSPLGVGTLEEVSECPCLCLQ